MRMSVNSERIIMPVQERGNRVGVPWLYLMEQEVLIYQDWAPKLPAKPLSAISSSFPIVLLMSWKH
ncbi:hypothetical protein D3C85_1424190 [compost metagenome]